MPYTINRSDGTTVTTISDGTLDSTTSLDLAGPNYVGYGEYLNENLMHLLENFASNTAPGRVNQIGQLWYDKANRILKVFTTIGYVSVSGVTTSNNPPTQASAGDIWYNSATEQLYIYDESGNGTFKLVGPIYTRQQGVSGAIPVSLADGSISGVFHDVVKLQFGNVNYATVSTDADFLPIGLPGYTRVNSGITFSSNVVNPTINASVVTSDNQLVMVDIVNRQLQGTVHGNVVATVLSGNLTGNVTGSLTGNVAATTLTGTLTGNVISIMAQAANFSSANVVIQGGYINNLANLSVAMITANTLNSQSTYSANLSTGNIHATGGAVTGLDNFSTTTGNIGNLSATNAVIAGGSITGTVVNATNSTVANFSTGNARITGGSASGIAGVNNTFTAANLINSTATTRSVSDSSTAIATTAFVHNYMPTGIIVMWNSSAATIPTGWQLCDGSNGTPDLRGQFIVGASAAGGYAFGTTGGTASVSLSSAQMPLHSHVQQGTFGTGNAGAHGHTASVSDPGHFHTYQTGYQTNPPSQGSNGNFGGGTPDDTSHIYNSENKTTGISVSVTPVIDHNHSLTLSGSTQSAGGSGGTVQPHENLPPYYALCYIQKM